MPAVRYKFLRVIADGNNVTALFTKGSSGFWGGSTVEVAEREKGCKEIYREAIANFDNSKGAYASFDSKEDARNAFYAIRNYKQQHGIPFDVESLD
jgi:hypothetical protein